MKNKILLFGAGLHAYTCIDIIEKRNQYEIVGFVDSIKKIGTVIGNYEVIGRMENLDKIIEGYKINEGFISIGTNWIRNKVFKEIVKIAPNFEFINLIHPTAVLGLNLKIGIGVLIGAQAFISSNCKIENFCLVHQKAHLGLYNYMDSFSSISLGSLTGGKVQLGSFSAITLRVVVNDRIKIGENSVIGTGSIVLKDIPKNCVAFGQPAVPIRSRKHKDSYLKSG